MGSFPRNVGSAISLSAEPLHADQSKARAAVSELISVIVATYSREDALDAALRSLSRQSDRRFEVVIADDGSGPATAALVETWKQRLPVPLIHVWHEDRGFRLAEIRNRAILACGGDYCVFLDGDCIARPDFVAAHRRLAEPGWFVAGNRVLLSHDLTARILRDRLEPESWTTAAWLGARMRREINRLAPVLTLPLGPLRRINATRWQGARGGNLAIRKADLMRVDGFDTEFGGWGLEDSDIIVRLIRSGTRRKDGRFATGVLHLWHPENDRSQLPANQVKLDLVLQGDRVQARRGLDALHSGSAPREATTSPR
jgi:glycosyltransferase involved in cell wall biosynthesis